MPGATIRVYPLEEIIAPELRPWRLGAALFSVALVVALVVAGLGIYGNTAFDVQQGRKEFAVRAALGASPVRLRFEIVRHSCLTVGFGALLGAGMGISIAGALKSLRFDVSASDPIILAGAVGIALASAF